MRGPDEVRAVMGVGPFGVDDARAAAETVGPDLGRPAPLVQRAACAGVPPAIAWIWPSRNSCLTFEEASRAT